MATRRAFLQSSLMFGTCAVGGSGAPGRALEDERTAAKNRRDIADKMTHVYKGSPPDHCVCDQALRRLPDGSWAIIFMTGGDHEPRKANYIALCRSKDQGKTWGKKQTVLRLKDRACLLSEVIVHGDEIQIMAVTHGGYFEDWRNVVLTSKDNGKTWGNPVPFAPLPRRTFVRNLYLSTWGEWILPYQSYDTAPDPAVSPLKDGSHRRARNGVLISRDVGKTWTRSAEIGPIAGWAENNVVELRDGRLVMLIRADGQGCLLRSVSTDRGRTWTPPKRSNIPNPGSKFRLHRLSTGRIVLIHNANATCGVRNPLAMWASDDDMASWFYKRVLVDFPGQLQYPDGFIDEQTGYVHFAFDYNRHDLIYVGAKLP